MSGTTIVAPDAQYRNVEALGNIDVKGNLTVTGTVPALSAAQFLTLFAGANLSTLPTANPGGGLPWVNGSNHNAITVGSGA